LEAKLIFESVAQVTAEDYFSNANASKMLADSAGYNAQKGRIQGIRRQPARRK
jgi:hypothetical protein